MANPKWDNHDPNHGKLTKKQLDKLKEDIIDKYGEEDLPIVDIIHFLSFYKFED